jgi:hypothetical protein
MDNKTKIIIGVVAGFVTLGIVVIVAMLFRSANPPTNTPSTSDLPSSYSVSVTHEGQSYEATVEINRQASVIDEPELSKYALVSFNSAGDLMWVICASDYVTQIGSSNTGNAVSSDPVIGYGIELRENRPNNLTIRCSK